MEMLQVQVYERSGAHMQRAYGISEYGQQEVMGASPLRLVVMAYDIAITACLQKDGDRASKAVSILRDALNFDYADTAVGLFKLYQWCLASIRKEDFAGALQTLKELREAWAEVERRLSPLPPSVV
jgi:flagellin-specific chaperone FliS